MAAALACDARPSGEVPDCVAGPLEEAHAAVGTTATMETYENAMNGHDQLTAACHFVAHRLGQLAYAQEGLAALDTPVRDCDLGYYHGVLNGMAGHEPNEAGAKRLAQACAQFTDQTGWQAVMCRHSLGHTIGTRSTAIADYAHQCSELDHGHTDCLGGAVMEQHMSGAIPPEASPDRLTECARLASSAEQHECVLYLVSWGIMRSEAANLPRAAQDWLAACHTHAPRTAGTCEFATGLGLGAHAYYDVNVEQQTDWARATCTTGDCGVGFGIGLARPLGRTDRVENACATLTGTVGQGCITGVADYRAEQAT